MLIFPARWLVWLLPLSGTAWGLSAVGLSDGVIGVICIAAVLVGWIVRSYVFDY
jgi:hypothetical protein